MACFVSFKTVDAEQRFKSWVLKGNSKSELLGTGSLDLKARILRVDNLEYLFFWEHIFLINMAWFLRLSLWFVFKRLRKDVRIRTAGKLELVELLLERGVGIGK